MFLDIYTYRKSPYKDSKEVSSYLFIYVCILYSPIIILTRLGMLFSIVLVLISHSGKYILQFYLFLIFFQILLIICHGDK